MKRYPTANPNGFAKIAEYGSGRRNSPYNQAGMRPIVVVLEIQPDLASLERKVMRGVVDHPDGRIPICIGVDRHRTTSQKIGCSLDHAGTYLLFNDQEFERLCNEIRMSARTADLPVNEAELNRCCACVDTPNCAGE